MNRVIIAQELVKLAKELVAAETDELTGWPVVTSSHEIPSMGTPFIGLLDGNPNRRQILKEVPFSPGTLDLHKRVGVYVMADNGFRAVKIHEELEKQRIFVEPTREYGKALRNRK
jgi:hypothetical protein